MGVFNAQTVDYSKYNRTDSVACCWCHDAIIISLFILISLSSLINSRKPSHFIHITAVTEDSIIHNAAFVLKINDKVSLTVSSTLRNNLTINSILCDVCCMFSVDLSMTLFMWTRGQLLVCFASYFLLDCLLFCYYSYYYCCYSYMTDT